MATLQIRIDDSLKQKSDSLFSGLGLDTPTAVRIFLTVAQEYQGFPFPKQLKLLKTRVHIATYTDHILRQMKRLRQCWRTELTNSSPTTYFVHPHSPFIACSISLRIAKM